MEVEVKDPAASLTKNLFEFRQLYGKNSPSSKSKAAYIHNVVVFKNEDDSVDLIMNDFRDETNFPKNSLHGLLLQSPFDSEEAPRLLSSKERDLAYYDIAAIKEGDDYRLLSTLFYTNKLVFIKKEEKTLKEVGRID